MVGVIDFRNVRTHLLHPEKRSRAVSETRAGQAKPAQSKHSHSFRQFGRENAQI